MIHILLSCEFNANNDLRQEQRKARLGSRSESRSTGNIMGEGAV